MIFFRQIILFTAIILISKVNYAQTKILVTKNILKKSNEYEPLGVNNFGDCGGTKHASGNLLQNAGFEPIRMRDLYRVLESGKDKGKRWITLDGFGTSKWLLYNNGTYSGANMRAYRFLDINGKPLPYQKVGWAQGGKLMNAKNATQYVHLFTTKVLSKGTANFTNGGWLVPTASTLKKWNGMAKDKQEKIKQGWRVYYQSDKPLRMDDVVIFERSFIWPNIKDFHPRTRKGGIDPIWQDFLGTSKQIMIPSDAPKKMNGGKGILEITPKNGEAQIWQKLFGGTARKDANWYGTLEENLKYRYEAWVKVSGASSGEVMLGFSNGSGYKKLEAYKKGYFGNTSTMKYFKISNQWQKVGFEFIAPKAGKYNIEGALIRYVGKGKLFLDNVKLQAVYKQGDKDKPFVIYKKLFKTMMDNQPARGRKGALRVWAGLSSASMASICSWNGENKIQLSNSVRILPATNISLPKALTIIEATGNSAKTRMVPWIIMQITHTEDEYRQLIEYLAAPYDPRKDSPKSKPMAYKRTLQRGNKRPWIDDFREFIIEFGNENWHNRAMPGWIGLGRYHTVHMAGKEYGLWSKYMISEIKKSPYWNGKKIHISLGGNYSANVKKEGSISGYGYEATVASNGLNAYHSHATYIGPRWETGESSQTGIDDKGVQKTLLSYRLQKEEEWSNQETADKRLHEIGIKTRMTAYEGGPSGFGLRAKTPEEDRAGEYYGKSYAMGTAVMDSWLDAWEKGWVYQCYLDFGQGRWWNSHTSFSQGHRPSPGFLVQTLINRNMANQNILKVNISNSPIMRIEIPRRNWEIKKGYPIKEKEVSLLQAHAHASKNFKKISVAISNLSLTKDNLVEIQLPINRVSKITLYSLTGGPRDTNLKENKVLIAKTKIDSKKLNNGKHKINIKAGSCLIIVYNK